jgi:hypothetical protein
MAGDELCPRPQLNATRAVTIAAPPEDIWPWLVQWGWNRAGFYSYDLLDNLGRPSARQILPQFQHLAVGDWVPMGGKTTPCTAYRVARLEPGTLMLWDKPGGSWLWPLEPGAAGGHAADHPAAQPLHVGQAHHRDRTDLDGDR